MRKTTFTQTPPPTEPKVEKNTVVEIIEKIEKKILHEKVTDYQCSNCFKLFNDQEMLER